MTTVNLKDFAYDGDQVIEMFTGTAGSLGQSDRMLYGPQSDQLLVDEQPKGNKDYWPVVDQEGSVVNYVDSTGMPTYTSFLSYNSFGQTNQDSELEGDDAGYTGQQDDTGIGLYYYKARYYDPNTGTFISEDPEGFNAGDTNLYRYVGNNPTDATDPTGTEIKIVAHTLDSGRIKLFQEIDSSIGWGWGVVAAIPGFAPVAAVRKLVEEDRAGTRTAYLGFIDPGRGLNIVWREDVRGFVELEDLANASRNGEITNAKKWFEEQIKAKDYRDTQTLAYKALNPRGLVADEDVDKVLRVHEIPARGRAEGREATAMVEGDYLYGPLVPVVVAGVTLGVRVKNVYDIVPKAYRGLVKRAFDGLPTPETLKKDLIVYRRWGGDAREFNSPWYSAKNYERAGNAKRYLALPESNSAQNVTVFKIPKGTTILRGKVKSMVGVPGYGPDAVGGGEQIYLPDPRKAIKVRQLP